MIEDPDPHDLAVSKLAAGRDNDLEFVGGLLRGGLVSANVIGSRIEQTAVADDLRERMGHRLENCGQGQYGSSEASE